MAAQPPRPAVMDHSRVTEFGSEMYFAKLQQEEQQRTDQAAGGPSATLQPVIPHHPFPLPVRERKKRNFNISDILKIRKPTSEHLPAPRRDSCGDGSKTPSVAIDQLFLALPTELQIEIIVSLPLSDILNLRLASKAWHAMITMTEVQIARYHLEHNIPAYAKRLYPLPEGTKPTLHHVCGLWHRLHVSAKLAYFICERVTKEIFLRNTEAQRREFAPAWERMRRRLIPLIFTIFHFFETYRARHLDYLQKNRGVGIRHMPYTLNPIEVEVMNMYDDRTLLQVHQVFPLVIASFCRRLRPPSYAGRVERTVRGYLREKPADEVHVAALICGGLRQAEKFWEIKGYNTRRAAVDTWYKSVTQEPVEPSTAKAKRGLRLGRKKSMAVLKGDKAPPPGGDAATHGGRESTDSGSGRRSSFIFNTSLALGMPMGPLSYEHAALLLPDLPALQQMWLTTAEALILDRKIVERPADIKRNATMMLDLIREGGMEEEDAWWYGQGISDSIRPPPGATEDDPIE